MVWLIFDSSPSGQHIYSRRDAQQEGEETLSVFVAELSFFQAQPRAESGGKRTHSCLQLHRALGALGAQSREQKAGRVFTAFFSVDFTVSLVCSLISSLTPQAFIVPLNWVSSVLSHPTPALSICDGGNDLQGQTTKVWSSFRSEAELGLLIWPRTHLIGQAPGFLFWDKCAGASAGK